MCRSLLLFFYFYFLSFLAHIYPSATHYGLLLGQRAMRVGDPCPMHKRFHTILGLMDAWDPLLSCVHHGRNHLPWLLHELTLNP